MSNFPLYTSLIKDISENDLTTVQKRNFIKKIDEIDKNGQELIYALIKCYQLENNDKNTSFTLPYNGLFNENNVIFDLDNLPKKLKQLLYKFINIHLTKMNEDNRE